MQQTKRRPRGTAWLPSVQPKVNELRALLATARIARGETSYTLSEKLGVTPETVRANLVKDAWKWNLGQLLDYCDALGIEYAAAIEAAGRSPRNPTTAQARSPSPKASR